MRLAVPCLLFAALLRGQTIELTSGEIVAGRVTTMTEDAVTIASGQSTAAARTLSRAEVAPRSWLQLLAARADDKNGQAHRDLAAAAEQLGLPGHAIAELQQAAQLDPSLREQAERGIARLRGKVAADLLAMAEEAAAAGRHGEAKLTAMVVAEKYQDTAVATAAKKLVLASIQHLRTTVRPATATTDKKADERAVEKAKQLAQRADALALPTDGGIGASVKETKQREQAVKLLEQALTTLAAAAGEDADSVRERVRDKLRDQYLALATNLLQRRSLDRATEYNGMACALDPEHGGCHLVQDRIVQARLTFGY